MDFNRCFLTADGRYPVADATWFAQQEKLGQMWPGGLQEFAKLFANMKGGGGGGAAADDAKGAEGAKTEAKAEKPKVEEKPKEVVDYCHYKFLEGGRAICLFLRGKKIF